MITKEQFEAVYNKYPPSKLETFCFKYFSTSALPKDKWLIWAITGILFIPFLIAFIFTVQGKANGIVRIPTFIFCVLLLAVLLPRIYALIKHKIRIGKIIKELNVTKQEYQILVDMYES